MQTPKKDVQTAMPVWQSALLSQGCHLVDGSRIVPLKLEPLGNCLRCTPAFSGSMLPFDLPVSIGQTITISWDDHLSRYIVESSGVRLAA